MKEVVILAIGILLGWGLNANAHHEDVKLPDLSSIHIPGLSLDSDGGAPKEAPKPAKKTHKAPTPV